MLTMQMPIKTPEELSLIKKSQPTTEEDLMKVDEVEFRARFRERCHHTMEIQVYTAIAQKSTLSANQTNIADMYFRVWDRRGLSHDLPDYKFASTLLEMAHQLQKGEIPDLSKYEPKWFNEEDRKVLDRAIYERRSVRHWDWDKEVPQDVINKILDAGLWGSHACNLQSIRFLVVHEKACPGLFRGGDIPPAPLHLVVCQDMRCYKGNQFMPDYNAIMDAGAAGQNMLLQAHAMGLGTCWVTFTSDEMRNRLVEKFNLPEYINIDFYIEAGYPTQTPCPPYRISVEDALLGQI